MKLYTPKTTQSKAWILLPKVELGLQNSSIFSDFLEAMETGEAIFLNSIFTVSRLYLRNSLRSPSGKVCWKFVVVPSPFLREG